MDYPTLREALEHTPDGKHREELAAFLAAEHPADVAHQLVHWEVERALRAIELMATRRRAEVLEYLPDDFRMEIALALPPALLAEVVAQMGADERADLFAALPEELQQQLLRRLERDDREDIRHLAAYPEGTAGALMTSDFIALDADLTVDRAIAAVRAQSHDSETIYRAYVVDPERKLVGSIRLQNLIFADPHRRIEELMEPSALAVHVLEDQENVARHIAKYDVLAVPVVDDEQRLLGMITHDDALDVVEAEATEDFHKVGSVGTLEGSVREASLFLLYRKRVIWLVVLVFANIFSGAGIAYFEDTIAAYIALVFFLPLLVDSGGNAGAQAATLMIRGLATGDVTMRHWGSMLGRELLVAAGLGLTMALAVSGIGIYRGGPDIAWVVALTMVLVVVFGSVIGMSLPFLLSRMKLDPATASAPLVTSIADAGGVLIYFGIATAILTM